GQAGVQLVALAIFDRPRPLLPIRRVLDPGLLMRDVRPRADERHAVDEAVDAALHVVEVLDPSRHPIGVDAPRRTAQLREDLLAQLEMAADEELAIVRNAADVPQQRHALLGAARRDDLRTPRERDQGLVVLGVFDEPQTRAPGFDAQTLDEMRHRAEVERRVAPDEAAQRLEPMLFDRRGAARRKPGQRSQHAELAVPRVPPGSSGDLAELRRFEVAQLPPVELLERSEHDAIDVEVEP